MRYCTKAWFIIALLVQNVTGFSYESGQLFGEEKMFT